MNNYWDLELMWRTNKNKDLFATLPAPNVHVVFTVYGLVGAIFYDF